MTKEYKNILVIKLGALGDFIQALGPMAAIRKHHKDAHITLLTTAPFQKFAEDCGYFNVTQIDTRPKILQFSELLKLRQFFNNGKFDRVYDLQNNDRTNFYFKLFSTPKPEWNGIAKGASHRNTSPERTAGHAFDGHVQTLGLAGICGIKPDPLAWMETDISTFPLQKPYVLIVPGCAPERPEKRWPADKYGRLSMMLSQSGYQPVLIGTKADKDATDIIASACSDALDLTAQTSLNQIATLARSAAGAIGNDTGPMHLIGATGCPSLVLFSSHSDPIRHAPKGENVNVLQEKELIDLKSETVLNAFTPRHEPKAHSATKH